MNVLISLYTYVIMHRRFKLLIYKEKMLKCMVDKMIFTALMQVD